MVLLQQGFTSPKKMGMECFGLTPVVPHKAVAEVSKI
jgi:hypothetical protein